LSASAGVAIAKLRAKIPDSKSDVARVMTDLLRGQGGAAGASDHWSREAAQGSRINRRFPPRDVMVVTPNTRS